ncbi:MAG: hypothetical protein JWO10_587 [Microbacteriaceae bacterium]|nr:hypothetical protein [Microbacteriaceae bacterium]
MTPDGVILQVNTTFLEWTGFSREQLIGVTFRSLLARGSQLFHETRYMPVLQLQGEVREVALIVIRADGSALSTLVNSVIARNADGTPKLVRTAVFDSTGRQDYERDLLAARRAAEASETRVRILRDAAVAFTAARTEEALAEAMVTSARDAFSASAAAVLLADSSGALVRVAGINPLEGMLAGGPSLLQSAELGERSMLVVRSAGDVDLVLPGLGHSRRAVRVSALSAVPVIDDGARVGALVCFFGRERELDEADLHLHAALASQAAQVLVRIRLQRQLEQLALHDQLTGLANRKLLQERMGEALASSIDGSRSMALVFLDLDGFKAVNDNLGHSAGDAVLVAVSNCLRSVVRGSDMIGRFGGDEFVVICEDADDVAARGIAERIVEAVRELQEGISLAHPVTASIGVALYEASDGRTVTPDDMFTAADGAMYESKAAGKDRVTLVRL